MIDAVPTVFIVDDDSSVRRALARLFRASGFLAETFASAEEFLRRPVPKEPGCLILDVRMPGCSGLELQEALASANILLPIVFLTGHGDIPMTVRAIKAGAIDFLLKPFHNEDLLRVVRQAIAKDFQGRQERARIEAIQQCMRSLTPRERQVLRLIVQGKLNKQVGRELGVGEKTIKVHRARVMEKMGADSLASLVRMVEQAGLPPDSMPTPLSPAKSSS